MERNEGQEVNGAGRKIVGETKDKKKGGGAENSGRNERQEENGVEGEIVGEMKDKK